MRSLCIVPFGCAWCSDGEEGIGDVGGLGELPPVSEPDLVPSSSKTG